MTDGVYQQFADKFELERLELFRTDHWICSLRPVQTTLGSTVLSLMRPCPALGELSASEGADLAQACSELERRLTDAFAPDRMNYLALMMIDYHVHFHVIPRYGSPRSLGSREWPDVDWPGPPDVTRGTAVDTIVQDLLDALSVRGDG
jgi:diadenosine tetraphosphate (Ap4A) HIT family hydrolase